jgi:ERCC4-related helicase
MIYHQQHPLYINETPYLFHISFYTLDCYRIGIKAREFVGQSSSKTTTSTSTSGSFGGETTIISKGLNQREQVEILKLFNEGKLNVLVATSVAEEGLDIGEVDLIVFFESVGSLIRSLQRMGRTGRKRCGRVIVLLSGEKDDDKIEKSSNTAVAVNRILRNPSAFLRLCKPDIARMIPSDLPQPVMKQQTVDIADFHMSQVATAVVAAKVRSRAIDKNV